LINVEHFALHGPAPLPPRATPVADEGAVLVEVGGAALRVPPRHHVGAGPDCRRRLRRRRWCEQAQQQPCPRQCPRRRLDQRPAHYCPPACFWAVSTAFVTSVSFIEPMSERMSASAVRSMIATSGRCPLVASSASNSPLIRAARVALSICPLPPVPGTG